MLIYVKITIANISMINTTSESLKARNIFSFWHLSCYELLTCHAQLSRSIKVCIILAPGLLTNSVEPQYCTPFKLSSECC